MVSLNRQSHIPHALVVAVLFVFLTSAFAGPRAALTWTQLQPANGFPERAGFASAYDPVSKKVIVFGGFDANGQVYSDTLTFDGKT
jgi:hypothetical protein